MGRKIDADDPEGDVRSNGAVPKGYALKKHLIYARHSRFNSPGAYESLRMPQVLRFLRSR